MDIVLHLSPKYTMDQELDAQIGDKIITLS